MRIFKEEKSGTWLMIACLALILFAGSLQMEGFAADDDGDGAAAPTPCPVNHCQSRGLNEGSFCFDDSPSWKDNQGDDQTDTYDTLITCGLDANGCRVVVSETFCDDDCNLDTMACNELLHRKVKGTVHRNDPLPSFVDGQPDATQFTGWLRLEFRDTERPAESGPSTEPLLHRVYDQVDMSNPTTEVNFEVDIDVDPEIVLAAGTYYIDAYVHLEEWEPGDHPATGDLMHKAPIEVEIPESGDVEVQIIFDGVFFDELREQTWK